MMDFSGCTLPTPTNTPAAPVADRVIDLALRVRSAHEAARQFLRRYAIEAATVQSTDVCLSNEFPRFNDRRPTHAGSRWQRRVD